MTSSPGPMPRPRRISSIASVPLATPTHSDAPQYSCGEAFRKIFYARDFLHAKAEFNCFPEPGRGNNPAPIVLSGPRIGYVEFHTGGEGDYRSLWLVFDGAPNAPELVEMISKYPRG